MILEKPKKRKRKPKRPINPMSRRGRAKAMRDALVVWSKIIRIPARCQIADYYGIPGIRNVKCWGAFQGCHLFGKKPYPHIKLDLDNGICGCQAHHVYIDRHDAEKHELAKRHLGETKYIALCHRALRKLEDPRLDPYEFLEKYKKAI